MSGHGQLFLTLVLVVVLPLLPQELYAWCPTVAGWLVRLAARLVPARHRARYQQEWLAGLEAWEGRNLTALLHAISVLVCAPWLRLRLRGAESAAARRGRVARPGFAPTAYRLVAVAATLAALLFAAWLSVDLGGPLLSAIVDHGTTALVALGAGMACLAAARRAPPGLGQAGTRVRRGWRLVGVAALVWGAAKLVWTYDALVLHKPLGIGVDSGYLAAIALLIAGTLTFPVAVGQPAERGRSLLDALIIAASLLVVSWVTTLSPLIDLINRTDPSQLTEAQVVIMATPFFDLAVATVAVSLLARTRRHDPAPISMVAMALLALAVASSGHLHLEATGRYGGYHMIDLAAFCTWLLILIATLRPPALHHDQGEEPQSLARITLPYTLVALAILTVITVKVSTNQLNRFLFLDVLAIGVLLLAQRVRASASHRRRNRLLAHLVEELSEREAELERALAQEREAAEQLRTKVRELETR
jgi:hypothetical protein